MLINFGYVAISMNLKDASPNKTVTLKNLVKIDRSFWFDKVEAIARQNIANTIRVLRYNHAYGVKVYRFTSKLVPFATHPEFEGWNWREALKGDFEELGRVVKETGARVSTHPDHFTLLNSPKGEVLKSSIKDLDYHTSMFELMGLGSEYKHVLHIGGVYKNKEDSIKRFYEGFSALEDRIKNRIILENDDKIYNAEEVLGICNHLGLPMVLDVHHDICNPSSHTVGEMIRDIFDTWRNEKYPPKVHLSSPKSDKEIRSHHDYINPEDFMTFLQSLHGITCNFDVMIEAKMKDSALFKLTEYLKISKYVKKAGDAAIELELEM